MSELPPKRVVEESLGSAVADTLRGPELGESIVKAIDYFVFRDIETEAEAQDLFGFIQDGQLQKILAKSFRGARWQLKVGLVLARPTAHPAHSAHVRAQLIEYGAIAESALREMLKQNGNKALPEEFDKVIKKCRAAGIITTDGAAAAQALRDYRNRVHLFLTTGRRNPIAVKDGRKAYKALTTVLNECRAHARLSEWHFGRP